MKKTTLILLAATFAFLVACSNKTDLKWKNSTNSAGAINDIVWENGDQTWNNTYATNTLTEEKEVSKTKGSITAVLVNNGSAVVAGTATDDTTGASSFVLSEGASNTVTIKVQ